MTKEWHAALARVLIEACGGLTSAEAACRVKRAQLSRAQQGEAYLTADVIADLEAHCGQPIYSSALFQARTDGAAARNLMEEACAVAEETLDLQREVRLATRSGAITGAERRKLMKMHVRLSTDIVELGEMLAAKP